MSDPLGAPVPGWTPPPPPERAPITGRFCVLEPLEADRHAADLWAAERGCDGLWTWLFDGPFATEAEHRDWVETASRKRDPLFFATIVDGRAVGVASFMRIDPAHGCIEVGNIRFTPALQGSTAATEALVLMMRTAFGWGYRRYEWKCNALNAPSRRAAQRLGLSFEGVFRGHMVVKGRSRDTAWYAATREDWPALSAAFDRWLDPANFDPAGRQRARLSELTRPLLHATG